MTLKLSPYLVMNGDAAEAIQFYVDALGAEILFSQTFAEMPPSSDHPLPDSAKERIGHAMLKVGETDLMFSDTFPGQPHQIGDQVTICISTSDKGQAQQFYDALKQGGKVGMELQETFFSPAYGSVTDKFGVTFQIYTEQVR